MIHKGRHSAPKEASRVAAACHVIPKVNIPMSVIGYVRSGMDTSVPSCAGTACFNEEGFSGLTQDHLGQSVVRSARDKMAR